MKIKGVEITHPDKVLFPKSHLTKLDMAKYYAAIAPRMLPLIKDRPISMQRFPQGIKGEGFFQKHAPEHLPKWIKTVEVTREKKSKIEMLLCNDAKTLIWLANQNCITPHIWLSKYDMPDLPDRMIFDLDPPSIKQFDDVVKAALILREFLEKKLKIKTFVASTGSRGLHLVVPLKREWEFDKVRAFARTLSEILVHLYPDLLTLAAHKNKRGKKIYLDVQRNGAKQTTVAPFAVRAKEKGPIALPLSWKEVMQKSMRPDAINLTNYESFLTRSNPWAQLNRHAVSLKMAQKNLDALSLQEFN